MAESIYDYLGSDRESVLKTLDESEYKFSTAQEKLSLRRLLGREDYTEARGQGFSGIDTRTQRRKEFKTDKAVFDRVQKLQRQNDRLERQAFKEKKIESKKASKSRTLLTGGQGVSDEGLNLARQTLIGS